MAKTQDSAQILARLAIKGVVGVSTGSTDADKVIKTTEDGLLDDSMVPAISTTHAADETKHLTSGQNSLLDALTASATELNYVDGVTSAIQTQLDTGAGNLTTHIADETKHLTSGQNSLIDAITASSTEINYLVGVTSAVQTQLSAAAGDLSTHLADATIHITSGQNSLLDALTATATELNYVDGVTSAIQTQLDALLPEAGGAFTGLTGAGYRDTSAAYDVTLGFASSTPLTAGRALTVDVVNASRTVKLAGNIDLGGNLTTTGSGTAALLETANVFTAAQTISVAGANSTSALYLTGALNVAGTGTTTFPQIFHQPIGTTAATTWSSGANGGTVFGANEPTGFVGNFADFRLAGVISAVISYDGRIKGIYNPSYPQFTAAGLETSGMRVYSDRVDFWQAGSIPMTIQGDAINLGTTTTINWVSGATLRSKAAATLQLGLDAAGVTNQMFTAASRITSDGVGANLTIAGGNGRGGAGGSLIFSTYTTAAAATIGTLTEAMRITTTGAIILAALPTADPGVSGQLYKSSGVVMQSA